MLGPPPRRREHRNERDETADDTSAVAGPYALMNPWPSGANTNWPSEPMAVARPIAHERRSSGTSRANAAMTIVNDAPERPMPTSAPAVSDSAVPLVLTLMRTTPSA